MTYLASCGGSCSKFSGATGKVWVKIDQAGYDASESIPWASKRLPEQNSTWTVKLPSSIAPGEYLLRYVLDRHPFLSGPHTSVRIPWQLTAVLHRHEILGLQRTNKNGSLAQFYPGCHQITVTGSGSTKLPEGIALPGAYQPDDTKSVRSLRIFCSPLVPNMLGLYTDNSLCRSSWSIVTYQPLTHTLLLVAPSGVTMAGPTENSTKL